MPSSSLANWDGSLSARQNQGPHGDNESSTGLFDAGKGRVGASGTNHGFLARFDAILSTPAVVEHGAIREGVDSQGMATQARVNLHSGLPVPFPVTAILGPQHLDYPFQPITRGRELRFMVSGHPNPGGSAVFGSSSEIRSESLHSYKPTSTSTIVPSVLSASSPLSQSYHGRTNGHTVLGQSGGVILQASVNPLGDSITTEHDPQRTFGNGRRVLKPHDLETTSSADAEGEDEGEGTLAVDLMLDVQNSPASQHPMAYSAASLGSMKKIKLAHPPSQQPHSGQRAQVSEHITSSVRSSAHQQAPGGIRLIADTPIVSHPYPQTNIYHSSSFHDLSSSSPTKSLFTPPQREQRLSSLFTPSSSYSPPPLTRSRFLSHVAVPSFPKGLFREDYHPLPRPTEKRKPVEVYQDVGEALRASLQNNAEMGVLPERETPVSRSGRSKLKIDRVNAVAGPSTLPSPASTTPTSSSAWLGVKRKYTRRIADEDGSEGPAATKKVKITQVQSVGIANMIATKKRYTPAQHGTTRYNAEQDMLEMFFGAIPPVALDTMALNTRFLRQVALGPGAGLDWISILGRGKAKAVLHRRKGKKAWDGKRSWFVWPHPEGRFLDQVESEISVGGSVVEAVGGEADADDAGETPAQEAKERKQEKQRLKKLGRDTLQEVGQESGQGVGFIIEAGKEKKSLHMRSVGLLSSAATRPIPITPRQRQTTPITVQDSESEHEREAVESTGITPSAKALGKRRAQTPDADPGWQPPHDGHARAAEIDLHRLATALGTNHEQHAHTPIDLSLPEHDIGDALSYEHHLQDFGHYTGASFNLLPDMNLDGHSNAELLPIYHDIFLAEADSSLVGDPGSADLFGRESTDPWRLEESSHAFGNGTIDPSLLGGSSLEKQPLPRSPTHSISSSSAGSPVVVTSSLPQPALNVLASLPVPRRTSHQRQAPRRIPSGMVDITDLDLSQTSSSDESEYRQHQDTKSKARASDEFAQKKHLTPTPHTPSDVSSSKFGNASKPITIKKPQLGRAAKVSASGRSGRDVWPMGPDNTFCHQCRSTTMKLKMKCVCEKKYCVRCISLRYDGLPFDASVRDWVCPACNGICNCDQCTRRRGEVYISMRKSKQAPAMQPKTRDTVRRPSEERNLPPPPMREITGPVKYWATIYGITGEKVGTAYVGGDGNDDVILAQSVRTRTAPPPRRRIFIGAVQPSWGLGAKPRLGDLESLPKPKSTRRAHKKRLYIGNRSLLSTPHASRPINSFEGPLSSLSESDGGHDGGGRDYSRWRGHSVTVPEVQNDLPPLKSHDADPASAGLEDGDVTRAISSALAACGLTIDIQF